MVFWNSFICNGAEYDLSHLHPSQLTFIQPANTSDHQRIYKVEVAYSLHCFTRGYDPTVPLLGYADVREKRTFDFVRYELSKKLPEIMSGLDKKKCLHSGKGNFFVIETITPNGDKKDYEVYFDVTKSKTPGFVSLYVQSAYIRDTYHKNRPNNKKIAFVVILHNKLNGKEIKIPT
ncbi:MAG: hypothetical protein ABI167_10305 [Nitrosospira sp.]